MRWILIGALAALVGCAGSPLAPTDPQAVYDQLSQACAQHLVYQPGANAQMQRAAYDQCMATQYAIWQQQENSRLAAANALLGAGPALMAQGQPRSYQTAPSPFFNCTTIGNNTTCW